MSDITILDLQKKQQHANHAAEAPCEECVGSGGWYRYEPALDPTPGVLYLSCLQCRGRGWLAQALA